MKLKQLASEHLVTSLFVLLLSLVAYVLLNLEQVLIAKVGYSVFAILLAFSYFSRSTTARNICSVSACLILLLIGVYFHIDIEMIEEIYICIPLLFLLIYPGTFWPILVSVLLVSAYISLDGAYAMEEVIEDATELVAISSFATVMAYFQQKSLEQMKHFRDESYTDYLTRLPNRKAFMERLNQLSNQSAESPNGKFFTLLIIDLDGFKKINDQLGHLVGDLVLKIVADRLQTFVISNQKAFRIGGDEFAFIVSDEPYSVSCVQALATKILQLSHHPYKLADKNYIISASIGIAHFPEDAKDIESLCSNADMAMYRAKKEGKNTFSFYDSGMMEGMVKKYELENDLKLAIKKGQMFLLYQPKVCLTTGQIMSAEALIRWQHPKYGFISPVEFISIAEESNSIIEIGHWVIETACLQMVKWQNQFDLSGIAVNVSSVQLNQPDFVNEVKTILNSTGCEPDRLEIEQTESWIMDNPDQNISVLEQLKQIGVKLALDDFGTAYSSLSQVGRLPLDVLKIDKSFIDDCATNQRDHMIVRTIIQLGHNLGMKIVAEGVETQAQRDLLAEEGCDLFQGYFFSKPITADAFELLLQQRTTAL